MKDRTYKKLLAYSWLYLTAVVIYQLSYFHSVFLYGWDGDAMYEMAVGYNPIYMMMVSTVIWVGLAVFIETVRLFLRYWITPYEG